ncbi:unnamed protein product [Leuciscus chuanchicus]
MKSASLLPPGSPRWNSSAWERPTRHISFNALLPSSRSSSISELTAAPRPPGCSSPSLFLRSPSLCLWLEQLLQGLRILGTQHWGTAASHAHPQHSCHSPCREEINSSKTSSQGFFS